MAARLGAPRCTRRSPPARASAPTSQPGGARPLGGLGTTVLVCWYGTGTDGWGPGNGGGGTFDIVCRSPVDDGVTFGPLVFVVKGETYELPYYTCPNDRYQRIWSSMLPAL